MPRQSGKRDKARIAGKIFEPEINMNTQTIDLDTLDALAAAIAAHLPRRIPLAVDLWSHAEIAAYLKVGQRQVADRYVCLPDFPRAIRIPTRGDGAGHPRYKAAEVIAWVGKYQERN